MYAFDIETIPNSSLLDHLPKPDVKIGNLKDPEKIAAKIKAAEDEQKGQMALSPMWGRVFCYVLHDGEESIRMICDEDEENEIYLLEELFNKMYGITICTWNGNSFDLPFVFKRAAILGIDLERFRVPPLPHWVKRYRTDGQHIDLMQVWANWDSQGRVKLDDAAAAFGLAGKLEIEFSQFPELLKTKGGRDTILDYCEQDVVITHQIYSQIKGILF